MKMSTIACMFGSVLLAVLAFLYSPLLQKKVVAMNATGMSAGYMSVSGNGGSTGPTCFGQSTQQKMISVKGKGSGFNGIVAQPVAMADATMKANEKCKEQKGGKCAESCKSEVTSATGIPFGAPKYSKCKGSPCEITVKQKYMCSILSKCVPE